MKKTAWAFAFTFALFLLFIGNVPRFQEVNATSEIFELIPEAYQGMKLVDLRKGDKIKCNFSVSNLGPYEDFVFGGFHTIPVNVKFSLNAMDRPEQVMGDFGNTSGGSFNYTAPFAGKVGISTYCGGVAFLLNAAYPVLTIDYEIEAKPIELINPDLMAWWKLDEGNGTVVTDSSGNNYEGIVHGASWIDNQGNISLNFNGISDYVSLPTLNLTNLDSLTVVAWIKSNLTDVGFIVYHGNLGEFALGNGDLFENNKHLKINPTYACFSVKLTDGYWYDAQASSPMKPNIWHQIVGVWKKGTSLKVYVDGVLVGENDNIPDERLYDPWGAAFPSSLGIYSQGYYNSQAFFQGQINDIMVFNKALNTPEIISLYGATVPTPESELFLTVLVIASALVIVVVVFAVFLFYMRKHKH